MYQNFTQCEPKRKLSEICKELELKDIGHMSSAMQNCLTFVRIINKLIVQHRRKVEVEKHGLKRSRSNSKAKAVTQNSERTKKSYSPTNNGGQFSPTYVPPPLVLN